MSPITFHLTNLPEGVVRKQVVAQNGSGKTYTIAQYVKPKNPSEKTPIAKEAGIYRSAIWNADGSRLLAIAPPRHVSLEEFTHRNDKHPWQFNAFMCEFAEGTMVNLFYDFESDQWEIATKNGIGANYWFCRTQYAGQSAVNEKTFRQMFSEALGFEETTTPSEFNHPAFPFLDTNYCYSFVLAHPQNHMVYNYEQPELTLVAIYKLTSVPEEDTFRAEYIPPVHTIWRGTKELLACNILHTTKVVSCEDFVSRSTSTNGYPMGWVLTDYVTGERAKIMNPIYMKLRKLRGYDPNLNYRFLSLLREPSEGTGKNKIREFLYAFPRYRPLFYAFYKEYHDFITQVHNTYVAYYVNKTGERQPKKYFVIAARIHHEVYLPSKEVGEGQSKIIITHNQVRQYVDNMPAGLIYQYLHSKE